MMVVMEGGFTQKDAFDVYCKWFKDRIGKRIYRRKTTCNCVCCQNIVKEGLIIRDEDHAEYLIDISTELGIEYSDKPLQ